ncbi:MAG: GAF domain-containing protein [Geobacteraceae bacterium]|nr:GAF domain-containing protein [Geobacteraceae bacterium]
MVPWVKCGIPKESLENKRFYIGDDATQILKPARGVAGEVFKNPGVEITYVSKENGKVTTSNPAFIEFDKRRPHIPYEVFISVPILGPNRICLGVLCLDSIDRKAFDAPDVQNVILSLGSRISAVILIYNEFTKESYNTN